MQEPSLEGLNEPQRAAVLHEGGPLVVFAGAGSGKTRVITYRVAHLIAGLGTEPWRILAVTFTNKAAAEMRERLGHLLGGAARELWVGTFHATCARLLRRHAEQVGIKRDFVIYDDHDQKAMLARVLRDMGLDEKRYEPKQVMQRIHRAKQEAIPARDFQAGDSYEEIIARIYTTYEKRMAQSGALDFDDLIFKLVDAMRRDPSLHADIERRFSHILVDEFQDTNHAQFVLVKLLAERHRHLVVVGDDDQSIYRWRGADRRNILDFRKTFPDATIIKLEQNYRSTKRILRAAHSVVSRNVDREPKTLWTDNVDGALVRVSRAEDERDEARLIVPVIRSALAAGKTLADIALFYRIHAQSRVFEEALRAAQIPYRVVGGMRFYERAEVKDVLAYLRVLHNPDDDVSLLRILNVPARGIGKTTIDRVLDEAARQGSSTWSALSRVIEDASQPPATKKKIAAFVTLITALRARAVAGEGPLGLARSVLEETRYTSALEEEDTPESDARLENLRELVGSLEEFEAEAEEPTLGSYLELVTLDTDVERAFDGDRLTLMTVHAAKGLEFAVVIVAGLEERMFPYHGVELGSDPDEMEEERRLAYVAFTRARERLVVSYAAQRRVFGQLRWEPRSRFIDELPKEDIEEVGARATLKPAWSSGSSFAVTPNPPPRAPVFAGESYVDRSDSDLGEAALRRGMRVRHSRFGVGLVQKVSPDLPAKITVSFPGWGTNILSQYLEPA